MLKVLRPALARVLNPAAEALARTPVTPNALTIIGTIGVTAGALTLLPAGHLFAGVMVCTVFVLTDMLDGTLARIKGTTGNFGAFLDSTMDRIADAAVFIGLAAWFVRGGHDLLLAGVAMFCLAAGSLVSYAKARAESLGLKCDVGFAERTERLLIVLVAAGLSGLGVPYILPVGLWLLAAASAFTFGQRVHAAWRSAAELAAAPPVTDPPAAGPSAAGEPDPAGGDSDPAGRGGDLPDGTGPAVGDDLPADDDQPGAALTAAADRGSGAPAAEPAASRGPGWYLRPDHDAGPLG